MLLDDENLHVDGEDTQAVEGTETPEVESDPQAEPETPETPETPEGDTVEPEAEEALESTKTRADKGAEKRIKQLDAQRKEERERRIAVEKELAELHARVVQGESALQNFNPTQGLGNWTDKNGQSVYQMTDAQLNQHLLDLENEGRILEKEKVTRDFFAYRERLNEAYQFGSKLKEDKSSLEEKRHTVEWQQVRTEYLKDHDNPDSLEPAIAQISQYLSQQYQVNPQLAYMPKKIQAEIAIEALGLGAVFNNKVISNSEPKAPDAKPKQSQVKPDAKKTWTRAEIAKMSQKEYLKHEKEIDKALKEGRIQ